MEKSLLDYAYDFVSTQSEPVAFAKMWAYIVENAGLTEEEAAKKVSRFYTNLQLDGRFVTLGENTWDLRVRHPFEAVHIDMRDVYADVDADSEDVDTEEIDEEEQEEYGKALEEPKEESEEAPKDLEQDDIF